MNSLNLLIPIYLILTSCSIFNNNNSEEFNPVFKAEITGEAFDIISVSSDYVLYDAVITNQGTHTYLAVFADIIDETAFPYTQQISIAMVLIENKTTYSSATSFVSVGDLGERRIGGSYYEINGDVLISTFTTPLDDEGSITVNIETLDDGSEVVYGDFEFSVVTTEPLNQFSQRIGQDTLHITNGEYRLLLDDRRE